MRVDVEFQSIEPMRLVIQRVREASVTIEGICRASIGAGHDLAIPLYDRYCELLAGNAGRPVSKGVFGADMQCSLINDGPVTIIIDSRIRE